MKSILPICLLVVVLVVGYVMSMSRARAKPDGSEGAAATKGDAKMVLVKVFDRKGELVGPVESSKVEYTKEEWKKRLTPEQFDVLRSEGTERPSVESCSTTSKKASTPARPAGCHCSRPIRSSIPARDGRAFFSRSRKKT